MGLLDRKPSKPAPKTVKVQLTFEMDEKTAKLFLQSAIERVINTSINLAEKSEHEDAYINVEDWIEWKPVVTSMWTAMHDAVYRSLSNIEQSDRVFTLHKGD